ncbi:hypothetical protein AX15_005571 [Amanita polypyramis BW_CC]|nr:hypothetical protein AX15_005571 [Amanita polypyramis BW_CC]
MGSLCFSSASILRCDLLSRTQDIVLIIPVVLEAMCSFTLAIGLWSRGRRHLFLVCESWMYLFLAVLDILSHLYPRARHNVNLFRNLDIVIGSMSFVPMLLYSSFLCSITIVDFVGVLPIRLRNFTMPFLILLIPILVGLNQAASFVGISYQLSPGQGPVIVFQDDRDRSLWTFFNSSSLALFTAFQLVVCYLATIRIVQIFLEQRRPEYRSGDPPSRLGGIGWINIGIKLAAIETTVGFANGRFGAALARRIMRAVSRALLYIGLIGLDSPHQISVDSERPTLRSPGLGFVSNPRLSTFRKLSPTGTVFDLKSRGRSQSRAPTGPPDMMSDPLSKRHVTIQFEKGTPQLDLRFSDMNFPNATDIEAMGSPRARPRTWRPNSGSTLAEIRRPFATGEDTDSLDSNSLRRVEIVSVPRKTYIAEKAKPMVFRTASGRLVNRSVSVCEVSSRGAFRGSESKGKRPMIRERSTEIFRLPTPNPISQPEENVDVTIAPSSEPLLFSDSSRSPTTEERSVKEEAPQHATPGVIREPEQTHDPEAGSYSNRRDARARSLPPQPTQSTGSQALDSSDCRATLRANRGRESRRTSHLYPPSRPPRNPSRINRIRGADSPNKEPERVKSVGIAPERRTPTPTQVRHAVAKSHSLVITDEGSLNDSLTCSDAIMMKGITAN